MGNRGNSHCYNIFGKMSSVIVLLCHVLSSRIFYLLLRMPQIVAHAEFAKFICRQLHNIVRVRDMLNVFRQGHF